MVFLVDEKLACESVEGCVEPLERILPNGEKHKASKRMSNAISVFSTVLRPSNFSTMDQSKDLSIILWGVKQCEGQCKCMTIYLWVLNNSVSMQICAPQDDSGLRRVFGLLYKNVQIQNIKTPGAVLSNLCFFHTRLHGVCKLFFCPSLVQVTPLLGFHELYLGFSILNGSEALTRVRHFTYSIQSTSRWIS